MARPPCCELSRPPESHNKPLGPRTSRLDAVAPHVVVNVELDLAADIVCDWRDGDVS
jgi:hypothetical protein